MRHDLRARYSEERLPRYTSYPTAPLFSPKVDRLTYGRWLSDIAPDALASLYLHIPFCRSMCWYCGCHTTITRHNAPIADYASLLESEIGAVAARIPHRLSVGHVHFGGGTPTILAPAAFTRLMGLLRARFDFQPDAEVAIEIDPRTLTPAMIAALGAAGVTRASLGVQSFDPAVQVAIRREQSIEATQAAVDGLRAAGISGINLDLLYGLPHQSVQSCLETVEMCLALKPDRFAVFGYAHVPSFKKHQRKIEESALPDAEVRLHASEAIAAALVAAGYIRIGLDHFARPDDSMAKALSCGALHRNFQGYTTDPCDHLLGFGASAIGRLPQGYVQNAVSLPDYAAAVLADGLATAKGYPLTDDDRLRGALIERLMCDFAVDVGAVCAAHDADPAVLFEGASKLAALEADGVVERQGDVVRVAREATFLVRTAASAFDAYLGTTGRIHSRAV